jgi:hypothetical protein
LVSYLFNARPAFRFAGDQSDKHHVRRRVNGAKTGRGILLWLLRVPIPIIITFCSYSITDQRRARVQTLAVHKDQREATGSSTSELVLATRSYTDTCRTG